MNLINKSLAKVGIAISLSLGVAAANAAVIDAWRLNLSLLNGLVLSDGSTISGATNATNIDHLVINGYSTVNQTVVSGVALGQPFDDSGVLQFLSNDKEGAGAVSPLNFGITDAASPYDTVYGYLAFDGLTGTLNADGSITFDPFSGTVKFWVENDGDLDPTTGGVFEVAEYDVIAPSGGSNLDFFGGTAANSTIDVTLKASSVASGFEGFFADSANVSITEMALHLINVDSLLDPNFNPNPDNSGIDGNGNGTSVIHVQNAGQYNLTSSPIPEPSSLALLGIGLLGFSASAWKRRCI